MKIRDCFYLNPPKNSNKFKDYINYIDTSSVTEGRLDEVSYLTSDFPSRAQRMVQYGDILYSSVRPNLKHYYYYRNNFSHPIASSGFVLLRNKDTNKCDTEYIFYFLSTKEVVSYLSNIAELSQATFPSFSPKDLGGISLLTDNVKIQRRIASILSAYDSLIENNQKRVKLLEQMAENLYKEWFVRCRFPGYENAEFEGGVPKGWRCGKLKSIAQDSGKSERKDNRNKYPAYVPIDCISSHSMVLGSMDSIENAESSLVSFKKTDILFGAMRPYFHKVIMAPFSGLTRSTCFVISPKNESYRYFLYLLLFQKSSIDYATTICVGSTMPYTVWKDFSRMPIVIPTEDIVIRFAKIVRPIIASIESIYFSNNYLVKQRDLLLPRLMSGKLSI